MIVDSAHYLDGARQQDDESSPSDVERQSREQGGFAWVTLSDPTAQEMEQMQRCFDLPGLAVEDVQEGNQRPKLERYGDENSFFVVKTARYDKSETAIDFGEVEIFVGTRYAVVVGPSAVISKGGASKRLDAHPDVAKAGPIAVAWAVLDDVIDAYEPVLDRLGEEFEETEEAVLRRGLDRSTDIYVLRREVASFLRALRPMLGPVRMLERGELAEVVVIYDRFSETSVTMSAGSTTRSSCSSRCSMDCSTPTSRPSPSARTSSYRKSQVGQRSPQRQRSSRASTA